MKTKECTKCFVDRPLDEFYKDKSKPDEHRPDCKACVLTYQSQHKTERTKYNKEYNLLNPWKRILGNINYRINTNEPRITPYYKEKGIKNFLTEQGIKELWVRDNADAMLLPEIDRKDNNKNYTLENCQFIEMILHRKKDNSKIILQYDLDGKYIKAWNSIKEASEQLNICDTGIIQVAKGKRITAGGYIWKYKND